MVLVTKAGEYGADLFEFFTIIVFPGEYTIDNRPGDATNANVLVKTGYTDATLMENIYKMNAVNGGVIVPRGTSIVGLDLRKTIFRPKYVPSPVDNSAGNTALFRVTGGCYFVRSSLLRILISEITLIRVHLRHILVLVRMLCPHLTTKLPYLSTQVTQI